ncbi:hypothetical protein [Eubacterium oxidoreducens]|uniref:Uncharacterized protein n=1 Tax=Eubacterium oxidoreducens TaxID=1732 RepID=A0A1G6B526_EUBOX|nr:hypothetical protein [Eubacterium oxidoreducens]SDB15754.1 hypothetical protein SAMN02910417_01184 [Eubacterium oxidoreducens]
MREKKSKISALVIAFAVLLTAVALPTMTYAKTTPKLSSVKYYYQSDEG